MPKRIQNERRTRFSFWIPQDEAWILQRLQDRVDKLKKEHGISTSIGDELRKVLKEKLANDIAKVSKS